MVKFVTVALSLFSSSFTSGSYDGGNCDVVPTGCDAGFPSDSIAPAKTKIEPQSIEKQQYTLEEGEAIILEQMKSVSNLRVVNGQPVTNFNDAPFYVRILQCHTGNAHCYICGASWITPNELITAAHCVDGNIFGENPNNKVYVYTWADGGIFSNANGYAYSIHNSQFRIHPSWDDHVGTGHDIAIVPVAGANWEHIVQLANIAEYNQLTRCDFFNVFGTGTTNTGESASSQLLKTDVMQYIDCYSSDMWSYEWYSFGVYQDTENLRPGFDHAICTNATVEYQSNGYSAICQGDSGGPLVHKDKLFGLVSYNYPPCNSGMPMVFTSVAHFLDNGWIQANSHYNANANFWCKDDCEHHSHCEEDDFESDTTIGPNRTTQPNDDNDGGKSSGFIESEHPYRSSVDTRWDLISPAGKKLKMWFSSFQTESHWDGVLVSTAEKYYRFSGNNDHVPSGAIEKLRGENSDNLAFYQIYGTDFLDSKTWVLCENSQWPVQVRFLSDDMTQDYGFKLNWEYVDSCDGDDNDDNDDGSCCEFGDLCISLDKHNELRSLHSDTEDFQRFHIFLDFFLF